MLSRREMLAISAASSVPAWLHPHFALAFADDDPTRVFTVELKPTDYRLGATKTLNDYFPFVVPKSKEVWEARRKQLREQLLVANGLWPLPEKTPLNARTVGIEQRVHLGDLRAPGALRGVVGLLGLAVPAALQLADLVVELGERVADLGGLLAHELREEVHLGGRDLRGSSHVDSPVVSSIQMPDIADLRLAAELETVSS